MKTKTPMPTVEYDGQTYSLLSRNIEVPVLHEMDGLAARLWIIRNTKPRGYSKQSPNIAFGGAISVNSN